MTAPRAKRRTAPFRTLEDLGAEMLQFHGGMGDPIYAAGSYFHSGKRHPSRAVEEAAEHALAKLYDYPDPSWTKKDMAGLWRAIITLGRLIEFDPATGGARRQRTGRDVGGSEREALLRAVGLGPEKTVRYNITTPQLRQMVKAGERVRVGRDMVRDPEYKIAKIQRLCSTCRKHIVRGERYVQEGNERFCRSCEHINQGLCGYSRRYQGNADIGQDLRCSNRATGVSAEGIPCCGMHSDAARARGRRLGGG